MTIAVRRLSTPNYNHFRNLLWGQDNGQQYYHCSTWLHNTAQPPTTAANLPTGHRSRWEVGGAPRLIHRVGYLPQIRIMLYEYCGLASAKPNNNKIISMERLLPYIDCRRQTTIVSKIHVCLGSRQRPVEVLLLQYLYTGHRSTEAHGGR